MPELALVTGGETGIGEAIVAALEAEGFEVRTASRRNGWDLTAAGATERLIAELPRLDLLVNNAGIAESAPIAKTSDEAWALHFELNVNVPFRLCRAAYPLLKAAPAGRVINMASTAALEGSPYIAAYAASKHALLGLTRVMAKEWKGIQVNAVCPGFVDTALTERSVANIVAVSDLSPKEAREALARQNKGGKLITPTEVADAVAKLVREGGTGQEVVLD